MAKVRGAIEVNTELCKGCELCVIACPFNVIEMDKRVNGKGYHFAYMALPEACTGCINCAIVCPDGVISVYKIKTEV